MAIITPSEVVMYTPVLDFTNKLGPVIAEDWSVTFPYYASNEGATVQVGIPFEYVAANWENVEFRLRAYFRATAGTVYVDLYDVTAAAQVAGSQLSTNAATLTLYTSPVLTLVDGHSYILRVFKDVGASGGILNASLFIRML